VLISSKQSIAILAEWLLVELSGGGVRVELFAPPSNCFDDTWWSVNFPVSYSRVIEVPGEANWCS